MNGTPGTSTIREKFLNDAPIISKEAKKVQKKEKKKELSGRGEHREPKILSHKYLKL